MYDRASRLIQKNNIPHDRIVQMKYKTRVEFHLERRNCERLAHQNLQGTFDAVFHNFLPLLARKWFDYHRQVVDVPDIRNNSYAYHYRQIVNMALAGRIPQYRNLCRQQEVPKSYNGWR
jgi:hypothetical protein